MTITFTLSPTTGLRSYLGVVTTRVPEDRVMEYLKALTSLGATVMLVA